MSPQSEQPHPAHLTLESASDNRARAQISHRDTLYVRILPLEHAASTTCEDVSGRKAAYTLPTLWSSSRCPSLSESAGRRLGGAAPLVPLRQVNKALLRQPQMLHRLFLCVP